MPGTTKASSPLPDARPGEARTRLRPGQPEEAIQAASDYRDIFGTDGFLLELMDHGLPIERSVRDGLLDIGCGLALKPLATNDSHYVTRDRSSAHSALLCVQSGKTLDDPGRFKSPKRTSPARTSRSA